MAITPQEMVGTWMTSGVQDGWSSNPHGPSGGWEGNLVLRANKTSSMKFTKGNIAPSRDGDWSLTGNKLTVVDSYGSVWTANVSNATNMAGQYKSGVPGAAGGGWNARKN